MLKKILVAAFIAEISLFAHTNSSDISGFTVGFFHPIGGADHILAMFAVGLWAAQIGGRALWVVPLSFICMMVVGAGLGMNGINIAFVENAILVSVLVLGAMIAFSIKMPLFFSSSIVGLFAIFHGAAHGGEMPLTVNGAEYGAGFVLATAMLHAGGIALGLIAHNFAQSKISRLTGATIAGSGLFLAIS